MLTRALDCKEGEAMLHSHNRETYENICELFKSGSRVAAVQPTGTGKSYLIMQLVKDNPERRFVICSPSNYIFSQLTDVALQNDISLANVTFMTYMKLSQLDESEIMQMSFDYCVLDEFHRCGSPEWQRGVQTLLSAVPDAKILGTTATPIRYLDSGRNMAQELFGDVYAVNMSLAEAIREHILPLPVYVTSWYSFKGDIEQLEVKAEQTGNQRLKQVLAGKIAQAKRMIAELDVGIDRIFEKHIPDRTGKYIVFCPNVERLKQINDECDDWLRKVNTEIHKYAVYSENSASQKQFDEFKSDNDKSAIKLLFCVDMLNEGVHFDDIDGVIMLRATKSANVFYQQLGRALACSEKNKRPVIFDIVNNFETGDTAQQYASIMEIARTSGEIYDDEIEFELYDYVRDIRDILSELNDTFSNSWELNFELMKEYFDKYGHFPETNASYDGVLIGKWAAYQRVLNNQKKLPQDRVDKLNEIGFPWDIRESNWLAAFSDLEELTQLLGHFPKKSEFKGANEYLSAWLNTQRMAYRNGSLEQEKAQKLISLGCKMKINSTSSWDERFEQLKKFVEQNGRFPANEDNKTSKELKALNTWQNSQRNAFLGGKLTDEHKKKLDSIGFAWSKQDEKWEYRFRLLEDFYHKNNRLPEADVIVQGVKLCAWHAVQMRSFKDGKLSEQRVKRYKDSGVPLEARNADRKKETWTNNYNSYLSFIQTHSRKPSVGERAQGLDLYKWSYDQVKFIRQNRLTPEQIEKLKAVGITSRGR